MPAPTSPLLECISAGRIHCIWRLTMQSPTPPLRNPKNQLLQIDSPTIVGCSIPLLDPP